jgi:hypothetical protein
MRRRARSVEAMCAGAWNFGNSVIALENLIFFPEIIFSRALHWIYRKR